MMMMKKILDGPRIYVSFPVASRSPFLGPPRVRWPNERICKEKKRVEKKVGKKMYSKKKGKKKRKIYKHVQKR
jgi:hypothetical protein